WSEADAAGFTAGQTLIALCDPLSGAAASAALAPRGIQLFALEMIPRITRAQAMDVLSSMALIAGYKAVLLAANGLPRMFPMFMTAAGTVQHARVFVVGAGVAGLQAIATACRLGAVVHAYDVRPTVKDEVKSVGGKFLELPLDTQGAAGAGGYASAMDENFYRRQQELMAQAVSGSDVVITTAVIPGKPAPRLITRAMVEEMQPGSIVIDLAAERGGNCEATVPGENTRVGGATVMGPTNLPAMVPYHASQLFSKNVAAFVKHVFAKGPSAINYSDEIVRETLICRGGELVHPKVGERLGAKVTMTLDL
ncbi:MAG: NAD(P)(+) transhydrogenase (Re/Si-specific) subunit alpha, partial [Planctomycetota bacterium]|nr:NAD(P)(+) transhydrogenase (Re/Si-specific) subunit alpha [Planctomycetota bacterium]